MVDQEMGIRVASVQFAIGSGAAVAGAAVAGAAVAGAAVAGAGVAGAPHADRNIAATMIKLITLHKLLFMRILLSD